MSQLQLVRDLQMQYAHVKTSTLMDVDRTSHKLTTVLSLRSSVLDMRVLHIDHSEAMLLSSLASK